MATASAAKVVRCGYCLQEDGGMVDPRVLPCSHVFCFQCLTNAVAEAKILQCGHCRTVHSISVKDLPSAENVGSQILLCEPCTRKGQTSTAEVFCTECAIRFCSKHQKHHEECFDHQIVGIDSYSRQTQKFQPKFCTKHPTQQISMGCRSCRVVYCVDCDEMVNECSPGQEHRIVPLKMLVSAMRKVIEELMTEAYSREGELSSLFKRSSMEGCEFDSETENMLKQLQAAREQQIQAVNDKYRSLEGKLKNRREQTKTKISQYQEVVGAKQNDVSSSILEVQASLRDGHDLDLVSNFEATKNVMQNLTKEQLPSVNIGDVVKLIPKKLKVRDTEVEIVSSGSSIVLPPPRIFSTKELPTAMSLVQQVGIERGIYSICGYKDDVYVSRSKGMSIGKIGKSYKLDTFVILNKEPCNLISYKDRLYVIVGLEDFRVFDLQGRLTNSWSGSGGIVCFTILSSTIVAAEGLNCQITVYTLTGKVLKTITYPYLKAINSMCAGDDNSVIASIADTAVFRLNIKTKKILWKCTSVTDPGGVTCNSGGLVFVTAHVSARTTIYILDVITGECLRELSDPVLRTPCIINDLCLIGNKLVVPRNGESSSALFYALK